MSLKKVLLAATMMALPLAATAQPISGFYIGAGAGVNLLAETDLTSQGQLTTALRANGIGTTGTASFDYGWVGVLSVGYGFGNGVRAEIEGSYRDNSIDGIEGFRGLTAPRTQSGAVQSYGVMANILYDFDLGPGSFMTPYIGLGAGYIVQNWDDVRVNTVATGRSVRIDGDNGNFAGQAIVGAAFPIASVPGLAVTAEYRFMMALSDDVDATFRSASGATTTTRGAIEVDNMNHSLLLGLRYAFGVTPPPPAPVAPAAAPAPARTFLVFFDFARADLTDRARQIIGEAASNAQRGGVTRIEVSGHTDTVGSARFNQALSERRAAAVAAELERRGVPRSAMVLQGFGFSRLLVPTAANVREPQNRRVEIVLR